MKHRILLFAAVILGVVSCTPAAIPDAQEPEVPAEPEAPIEVETVTPDVPTQENGYDGILATDAELDKVVSGDALYWENQTFGSTVYFALCIGVFNSKVENAARLMSKSLRNGGGEKTAKVNEARGAGSETSYLCALGKVACGVSCLHIGRRGFDIGEK